MSKYGFGWELDEYQGIPVVSHDGSWLAFRSPYIKFPSQKLTVVLLLNRAYDLPETTRTASASPSQTSSWTTKRDFASSSLGTIVGFDLSSCKDLANRTNVPASRQRVGPAA